LKVLTDQNYRRSLRVSIAVIYLIIIAGAVVRMTGAGMGCPDWPKCFGYLVPPTERAELDFSPQTPYKQGMVIIVNEELRVAKDDFFSEEAYDETNWEPYTKHDYAVFNVYHTWTEYINRLIGALGGLAILITCFFSLKYIKSRPKITILSIVSLMAMLIQAVIGKIVVDTNLSPALITIHMIVALLIVGVLIYLLHSVKPVDARYNSSKSFVRFSVLFIFLTLIQVALGTQVRQYIDHQVDLFGYPLQSAWLENGPIIFYVHRSYSIMLVILLSIFLFKGLKKYNQPTAAYYSLIALFAITIASGVAMNYLEFPFGSQALHLVFASLILGVQFYLWMRLRVAQQALPVSSSPF
jgi:cytochrome c oxidase assembly protein subunit 15